MLLPDMRMRFSIDKKTPPNLGGVTNLTDRSKINTGSICFVTGSVDKTLW
jgi:hypothetical protein